MKTQTQNKQTLIETIKNKKQAADELKHSIHEQQVSLIKKVVKELRDLNIDCSNREGDLRIDLSLSEFHQSIHQTGTIHLSNGNFQVSFPPIVRTLNYTIQSSVYSILSKFVIELGDIQMDMVSEYELDRWDDTYELERLVSEELFNQLETEGVLEVGNSTYHLSKGVKGRYNFTLPSGETKSYYKNDITKCLLHHSRLLVNELVKK